MFVPEEFAMTAGKSHGPAGLAEPEVRRTELSFCPGVRRGGHIDRRAQVNLRNLLRSDTPA